ncbi:hypothetical protein LINPERPRIM_LOCUS4287 [Linum perenne]
MSGSGAPGQASKSSKVVGPSSHPSEPSTKRKLGVFQKDLQRMMYGFGDDPNEQM